MTEKTETKTQEKKLNIIQQKMIEKSISLCDLQAELYLKKVKVSKPALKNWTNGTLPRAKYILPLCKILKIKPNDILKLYTEREN